MNSTLNKKNNFLTGIFQLIKYSMVGGMNFIIDFSIVKILSLITGITSGIILFFFNLISFLLYSINGFFMNRKFTFKTTNNIKHQTKQQAIFSYFKYAAVLGIAMILNSVILIALTAKNPLISSKLTHSQIIALNNRWFSISKLTASITTGIFSFLINKFFVFNNK